MHNLVLYLTLVLLAYGIGSISSAILLCRLFKLPDPRTLGSKNPGTTNVLRIAGKKIAALVLCCDTFKAFIFVYLVKFLIGSNVLTATVAIAVFLGNLFPIFFNFSGGKGIATTLGILLALCWQTGVLALMIWILTFATTKISSLSALIATISTMILAIIILYLKLYTWIPPEFTISIIFISALIIYKHRLNIFNLFYKLESKI